jgi:cysteine desulfuration protein SufE
MSAGESFEEIVENFELFDDWEERYRYVIDLGRGMPELPEERRNAATKVEGCASQVWLVPEVRNSPEGPRLFFQGDSDAMIVRGLISILVSLISGRRLDDIRRLDVRGELARLQLDQALSSQRSNGLRAMVARIEDIDRAAQAA